MIYRKLKDRYAKYDLTGQKINKLTVLHRQGSNKYGKAIYLVKCDCGTVKTMTAGDLKSGRVFSCGCYAKEMNMKKPYHASNNIYSSTLHKRLYGVYMGMKKRCYNPKHDSYKYYGGRGIKICDEWLGNYGWENFCKWSLENGYFDESTARECTIDRVNCNGNYSPNNCRWVDIKIQASNKRVKE